MTMSATKSDMDAGLFLAQELQDFTYSGSWQETYVRHSRNGRRDFRRGPPLRVAGFFSDTLYQSWHFARASLRREWLERDNIPRREAANLTASQFREQFEAPNQPMILTGEVSQNSGMAAAGAWQQHRKYMLLDARGRDCWWCSAVRHRPFCHTVRREPVSVINDTTHPFLVSTSGSCGCRSHGGRPFRSGRRRTCGRP